MLHIICNTCVHALPDMSALTLRCRVPSGIMYTYQSFHSSMCYKYYMSALTETWLDNTVSDCEIFPVGSGVSLIKIIMEVELHLLFLTTCV